MKIIEKSTGKVIVVMDEDIVRIVDAKNYELVIDDNEPGNEVE